MTLQAPATNLKARGIPIPVLLNTEVGGLIWEWNLTGVRMGRPVVPSFDEGLAARRVHLGGQVRKRQLIERAAGAW